MDEEVIKWILEFLLRQDIEDRVLNNILSALPLPKNDFRLKKGLLIRRIGTAVSNGSVDETILDILETVEELEYGEGKHFSSKLMKAAYCAVAVDCTARFLQVEEENNGKYLATAKRIWKDKITKMKKSERKVDLLSEELLCWREDFLAAIWESDVRNKILSMDTRSVACKTVKKYLVEAWRELGPSYLELVAENVIGKRGEIDKEMAGSQRSGEHVDMNGQVADEMDDEQNLEVEESQKMDRIPTKQKQVARSMPRRVPRTRRAKIVDAEELDGKISPVNNHGHAEMPTVPKSGSCRQEFSYTSANRDVGEVDDMNGQKNENEVDDNATEKINECDYEFHDLDDHNLPLKGSLTPSRRRRGDNSSDEDFGVSPVKLKAANPKRRRVKKLWSPLEEDTLRVGVKKFGKGNWKLILHAYRDTFEGRNEVDLKDKWRNITR